MATRRTANPLRRGLACLSCRKRKLKCDGTQPVCRQCSKMGRSDECEFDDKKQKSRTQKLREKLSTLENRLRELESEHSGSASSSSTSSGPSPPGDTMTEAPFDPEQDFQSLETARPPNMTMSISPTRDFQSFTSPFESPIWPDVTLSSSSSSSSSHYPLYPQPGALGDLSLALSSSAPNSQESGNSQVYFGLPSSPFASTSTAGSTFDSTNPRDPTVDSLPLEEKRVLLDTFLAHRHQCWFDGDISRLETGLTPSNHHQDPRQDPHPALMNAIFLLGCHFSFSPFLTDRKQVFYTRTLHGISISLDSSDRLVDIVQASSLLAVYLYVNSRPLEGYCQSFSAARLALGLGLHQIRPLDFLGLELFGGEILGYAVEPTPVPIPPPRDSQELNQRISAFWQIFMVDRCWSVANGLPLALPDGTGPQMLIKTPWPSPVTGQESITNDMMGTVRSLFESSTLDIELPSLFIPALRVKAAALYEQTYRLGSATQKSDKFWTDYRSTEMALRRFAANLPPFIGYEGWRPQPPTVNVDLFTIHTMIHVSWIHLQKEFIDKESLEAANSVLGLVRQLSDADYSYLDPALSACWSCVAKMYISLLKVAVRSPNEESLSSTIEAIEKEVELLILAMKALGSIFPLATEQAFKIESERLQARMGVVTP